MSDVQYYTIGEEEEGQRLDNYLIRILKGVPKSHIYRIIRSGEVRINKKRAKVSTRLSCHDAIRVPPIRLAAPQEIHVHSNLEKYLEQCILYEDKNLLVINKPSGMAVHGGSGLSLGIIEAFRKIREDLHYLELAHRLDKETSGCLLLAKKKSTLRALQQAFTERSIIKTYWVLLSNPWKYPQQYKLEAPLVKNILKSGERLMRISEEGKPSLTHFQLIENYKEACWVEAQPQTGRTHQIRIHAAAIGHPVLGDSKYNPLEPPAILHFKTKKTRLYLHAKAIEFNLEGKKHRYEADLDENFKNTIRELQKSLLNQSIALRKIK